MLPRFRLVRLVPRFVFSEMVGFVLERIRNPIRNEARDTPLSRMSRYRVEIFVRPGQKISTTVPFRFPSQGGLRVRGQSQDSPSRISLCEGRLCLLYAEREVWPLDDGHLGESAESRCKGTKEEKAQRPVFSNGPWRLFIPAAGHNLTGVNGADPSASKSTLLLPAVTNELPSDTIL